MSNNLQPKKKFKDKLKDTYRLVIMDVEDLKEVGTYQFSMRRLYAYIFGILALLTILIVSLIAFTPIKRLMPGYGDIEQNYKFLQLRDELQILEEELESQMIYTQGLQNMLSGNEAIEAPTNNILNESKEKKENVSREELAESKISKSLDTKYFVAPVTGKISEPFNSATKHYGVDIIAPQNTAIKSIASGMVIGSDFTLDTGNTITIQHNNNIISIYKHNSALLKKVGERVSAGEAIAIVGNTGKLTTGPHLHFELWYNGIPVNPTNFIEFQ